MKRRWFIGLGVLLLLVAGGAWYVRARTRQQTSEASQWHTVAVKRGTLEASIDASGTVRAAQSATLTWQISGIVGEVNVALGEKVARDETLAALRHDSWPQALLQAQVSLLNAQKQLQDLQDSAALQYAEALQRLATAKRQRDRAQNHYDWLTNWDKEDAQKEYDKWHGLVQSLQHDANDPTIPAPLRDAARAQLEMAKRQEQVAKANLDGPSDLDLEEAEANLALAKAQVEQAQRDVDRWKDGAPADQVAILQAQIDTAQATLDMASLKAPFSGTISDIQVHTGDVVAPGTIAFRIDALQALYVDVELSELDVAHVSPGQPAILSFDALPGRTYHGEVEEVALAGVPDRSGNVNFRVTVRMTDADEYVRPGMTAAVNIQTTKIANALLVPSRAVRVKDGKSVVFVLKNGQPQPVQITLGATSGTLAQVLKGDLKEGDLVVLNPPAETFNFFGGQ